MATQIPLLSISAYAGADLSAQLYRCVKLDSTSKAVLAGASEAIIGVLQTAEGSGKAVSIEVAGTTKVVAGDTVAAGKRLQVGTNGRVIEANFGTEQAPLTPVVIGYSITGGAVDQTIEMLIK
jgi:hypothetical protein